MFKMNKAKKLMLTMTVMAALFNGGSVNAAETQSSKEEIQVFDESQTATNDKLSKQIKSLEKRVEELSKSKKSGTKKEIE